MKKLFTTITLLLCTFGLFAQEQLLSPKAYAKAANVEISYGQPSKRNRVIFGDVVPYNELWRAGANEATEITFKKDCLFGGKLVKAGKYTLFAIPQEKEWTVILNSELGQWGTYEYDKNKVKNVAEVKVPVSRLNDVQEKLTYTISDTAMNIEWDESGVTIPLKF